LLLVTAIVAIALATALILVTLGGSHAPAADQANRTAPTAPWTTPTTDPTAPATDATLAALPTSDAPTADPLSSAGVIADPPKEPKYWKYIAPVTKAEEITAVSGLADAVVYTGPVLNESSIIDITNAADASSIAVLFNEDTVSKIDVDTLKGIFADHPQAAIVINKLALGITAWGDSNNVVLGNAVHDRIKQLRSSTTAKIWVGVNGLLSVNSNENGTLITALVHDADNQLADGVIVNYTGDSSKYQYVVQSIRGAFHDHADTDVAIAFTVKVGKNPKPAIAQAQAYTAAGASHLVLTGTLSPSWAAAVKAIG